jgi:hypothetical protein
MSFLCLYILVIFAALIWVGVDRNAIGPFEFLSRNNHATARDMGIYSEWVRHSLGRLAFLTIIVTLNVVVAFLMFAKNPLNFGQSIRGTVLGTMLVGSLLLFAMPRLSVYLRLKKFLYFKAAELTNLVSIVSSKEGVRQHLKPSELDLFHGHDGWTAWHPSEEAWNENPLWAGLVPLVYLHQDAEPSLIVTVDGVLFLAWNLPCGSVTPGKLMPICPLRSVKAVHNLRGRVGWSVVQAELVGKEVAA